MANVSHASVMAAFEKRYDYQSARNVLKQAMSRGGLTDKDAYNPDDCQKIVAGLQAMGERGIDGLILALTGGAPAAAPAPGDGAKAAEKPAAKEEKAAAKEEKPAKDEKHAKDEPKAEAKEDKKAAKDDKKEEKKDDKKEDKKAEEKK
jgi:hypothetical protein